MKRFFGYACVALAGFLSPAAQAGPILASYTGSYSVVTEQPTSTQYASLRLALGALGADCTQPGQCTELALRGGLTAADLGLTFALSNSGAIADALTNGAFDVFWMELTLGPSYQLLTAGGGTGLLDIVFAAFNGQPIEAVTFQVRELGLWPVNGPSGPGTQATLHYTISIVGADTPPAPSLSLPEMPGSGPMEGSGTGVTGQMLAAPPAAVPEPSTWLGIAAGLSGLYAISRRHSG